MLFVANAQDLGVCAACNASIWLAGVQLRTDSEGRRAVVYCKSCGRRESVKANMRKYYKAHRNEIRDRRQGHKRKTKEAVGFRRGRRRIP